MKKAGREVFPNRRNSALYSLKYVVLAALALILGLSAGFFPTLYHKFSHRFTGEVVADIQDFNPVAEIVGNHAGPVEPVSVEISPPTPAQPETAHSEGQREFTSSIVIYPDSIMEYKRR